MSALTRYPVPQAKASGAVDGPRLYFRLEPTPVLPTVLEFLMPQRGLEAVESGAVDDPRLYFRLTPTVAPGRIMSSLVGGGGLVGSGGNAGPHGGLAG